MMAKDSRKRNNADNNQNHSCNRNDIVGEYKSLLLLVCALLTGRWHSRSWRFWQRYVELWRLQSCNGDRWNLRERNCHRRCGLRGSSGGDAGIEARRNFGDGPAPPGVAEKRVPCNVEIRLGKRFRN